MSIGARIGAGFVVGLVIIAAIGGSAYLSTQQLLEANRQVTHTHEVLDALEHTLSTLKDAETGQRGFVLTGEERYLEPYNVATGQIQHEIDALDELTRDDKAQQESLRQVQKLADAKLAGLRETIQLRRKSGLEAALPVIRADRGKKIMDKLRGVVAEMQDREQQLLDERNDAANASANRTIWSITLWMPIALLVLAVAAVVLMRSVRFAGPTTLAGTPAKKWGGIVIHYAAAGVFVAVAVALHLRLTDSFGPLPTFIMLYPAVLLAASIGGGGPGIAATVLAALAADYWVIPPYAQFTIDAPNDVLALGIFTGCGLFLSILAERLRRARWAEAISVGQEQQLEELSRLNEELSQQSEELSQQSEELVQQNEELQTQSEEIQTLNTELKHREDVLQMLLDAACLGIAEKAVMQEICAAAKEMFGPAASAVLVLEPQGGRLAVHGQAGLGAAAATIESLPATNCFAELVIAENKTAALADASLRPDISLAHPPGEQPFQAVLAAPMRIAGEPFGVVDIYSHQKQEWTAEQFHLAEWLAAQCSRILETLRLQAQLHQLYAEQQTIFNSVPAMIWYKDTKNNFVRVNRAVALSVGRPLDKIEGKSAYELFPDEAEGYYRDDLDVIHSGQPKLGIVEEMGTASGEKRWVQTDKIPYRNEAGEITGVLVLSVDITERKRAEDDVRRSQELLQAIIDNTPALIYVKDLEGRITIANRSLADAVGMDLNSLLGKTSREFVADSNDADVHMANDRRVIETGAAITVEESSGGRVFLSMKFPLRDAQGRIFATAGVSTDITERKQAEEALRRTAEDLARSNKDLEQFAYVASHDLREPLRMVTGFMSLLKDRCQGKLDAKADEYIFFASDAATRMQGLIDDLLAYSRLGREEVTEPTDVGAVLDRVLRTLSVSIQESAAVITHDPLPTIAANSAELAQVFQNLLGNAITFRGERKPEIHVGARRQPEGWLFTVRDNGIGIDPQFADRIFMIFQRLHTREQYPGTGIGLAICKKVVERHGGRIWVESQPGNGSTFSFTIPDTGKERA